MKAKTKIALVLALLLIIATASVLLLAERSTTMQIKSRHFNFTLGVCTHGNESSEITALKAGVRNFRTDITLSASQIRLMDYEHERYNASYLGILDYDTLPGGSQDKNWSLSMWNESVKAAVEAYPWISEWEIWNEPWVKQFQTGMVNGSAYNYFLIIKAAANAIRSLEPNATIVCFGGAPIGSPQIFEWYAEVWSYGAWKYCNAVSVHAYLPSPIVTNFSDEWAQYLNAYENLTHKPIFITEFGFPASSKLIPGYSQKSQMEFMEEGLDTFSSLPYIKQVYWYDLWGLSDGALGNDYGLLNLTNPSNGTPNLAWYTFLQAYRESSP